MPPGLDRVKTVTLGCLARFLVRQRVELQQKDGSNYSKKKTACSDGVQLSTVSFKASGTKLMVFKDPAMKTANSILKGMLKKVKREGVTKTIHTRRQF